MEGGWLKLFGLQYWNLIKVVENQVIKDQTLQGCHYVIMGFRALKLLSEGFGGVIPCNHQYRGCHLKNPTDINIYRQHSICLRSFYYNWIVWKSPEATVIPVWKMAVCKRGICKQGILKHPVFNVLNFRGWIKRIFARISGLFSQAIINPMLYRNPCIFDIVN